MSKILTRSAFYYGHTVTFDNQGIDFKEGAGPELFANLRIGDYTLTEYAAEFVRALNETGSLTYGYSINRLTRIITIIASGPATFLISTGSRTGISTFSLAGFIGPDVTATSFIGNQASGSEYLTQYPVFDYDAEDDGQIKEGASVQVSTIGVTQLISFADGARIAMNIRLITDITGVRVPSFFENVNGRFSAKQFMRYLITKSKVEFMPDVGDRNTFTKVILESTAEDRAGTAFKIKNMKTPNFYETGNLIFRKVLT